MVVGENCVAQVALVFAAADIDAWVVHVNARLSAREIDKIRDHSGARRVIYTVAASPGRAAHAGAAGAAGIDIAGLGAVRLAVGPLERRLRAGAGRRRSRRRWRR